MSTNQSQTVDNFDNLIDLSEYDNMSAFPSPATSPTGGNKNQFPPRPSVSTVQTPTLPSSSSQPPMSGPSHRYDLYKQQTGIVPGALASTHAVNQANSQISGYNSGIGLEYMNGLSPESEFFDFNSAPAAPSQPPSGALDMDVEFDSPADNQFLFPGTETINPSAIAGQESPADSSQSSNVGRLWPGMHTQAAAMAKAQAQQRQQHQQHHQPMMQQQQSQRQPSRSRTKSAQPTDPIVEQKITQLLNSMRAKTAEDLDGHVPLMNMPRPKKDEEDMDEDERLLASEEGKKLSSKERRQLRNKVSARAFRSRRKEYIGQLESEIANKVSENGDLRLQNRTLMEENKRLTDLTRMLLSSPSFSSFLDHLSNNPQAQVQAQPQPQPQPQQAPVKVEQRQSELQQQQQQQQQSDIPKDANPYVTQQTQPQQIGMAMLPEQPMDMSMLNLNNGSDAFNLQPQVFAVTETPDGPAAIDTSVLSGKDTNFVGEPLHLDEDKVELPALDAPKSPTPKGAQASTQDEQAPQIFDDDFENDPEYALYHSSPIEPAHVSGLDEDGLTQVDIFGGIEPEKVLARYQLVDASAEEQTALVAMVRVERLCTRLDPMLERLHNLCL